MVNLQELDVFVMTAEQGNFSAAARALHLSQPAVSQHIRNLERHFDTELFVRHGHSVQLTDAGQMLLRTAKELLTAALRLEGTMVSVDGAVSGKINIGCSTTSGKYLLPRLVARFREQYAQVRVDIVVHNRENTISRLLEGHCHFAVSSKEIEHPDLEYSHLYTDEIVLVVPAAHPWANYPRIYPDDILEIPLIMREDGCGTSEVLVQALQAHDISPDMLNVVMTIGNAEAISVAVEEGLGAAFISRLAASRGLASGTIMEVAIVGVHLTRVLYFIRNRRISASRSQAAFWDFIKEHRLVLLPAPAIWHQFLHRKRALQRLLYPRKEAKEYERTLGDFSFEAICGISKSHGMVRLACSLGS